MTVNISASFSKDDKIYNGLEHIIKELLDEPLLRRVAVVVFDTSFSKRDFAHGGTETPTIRIVQIEPLADEAAVDARALLADAYSQRTGGAEPMQDDLFSDAQE